MKHRIGTPVGVMTMERPRPLISSPLAGLRELAKDMEREDDKRGFEAPDDAVFLVGFAVVGRPLFEQPSGQCSRCGGRFPGWNGGVCNACKTRMAHLSGVLLPTANATSCHNCGQPIVGSGHVCRGTSRVAGTPAAALAAAG